MRVTAPLFAGLTRPATFGGLPLGYLVVLGVTLEVVFIATGSFFVLVGLLPGYVLLRFAASWEPHLVDILITVNRRTPPQRTSAVAGARTYRW